MAKDAGFKFQTNIVDYNTAWSPQYRDARGNFEGIAHMSLLTLNTDPVGRMSGIFSSNAGVTFAGFDPDGKGNQAGDPYVDEQFSKARREIDTEKRRQTMLELQRYLGEAASTCCTQSAALRFRPGGIAIRRSTRSASTSPPGFRRSTTRT